MRSLSGVETDVLVCLATGRQTLDLLCDSLRLQCHEAQRILDQFVDAGLVRQRSARWLGALEFHLTARGRTQAMSSLDEANRRLAERGYARDDLLMLRGLANGNAKPADCGWGYGATRQRLWEGGLITIRGFIRPRASITHAGTAALAELEGAA